MTSAAAPADRPGGRILLLAHYPVQVCIALVVFDTLSNAALPTAVRLGPSILVVVTFAAWMIAQYRHQRSRLCERCASGAPLDPQAEVAKKMHWLRLTHRLFDTWLRWLPLGVMVALLGLSLVKINDFSLSWFSPLFWVALLAPAMLLQVHNPLQPWCPFCRWDDGGDEEPSPEPTPDPSIAPDRDKVA